MEMYSVSWGLLIRYIMLGPIVGALLVVVGIPVSIYSTLTHQYRRGLIANRIAIRLSIAAVLLTLETWYELVTGRLLNGKQVNYSDPDFPFYATIAGLEACAVAASLASSLRQRMRQHAT